MSSRFSLLLLAIWSIFPNLSFAQQAPVRWEASSMADWIQYRPKVVDLWMAELGEPRTTDFVPDVESLETFQTSDFRAETLYQKTGQTTRQKMVLLKPLKIDRTRNRKPNDRIPGIVVPYYDPDRMCGHDLKTHERIAAYEKSSCFGLQLVRQGYIVLCVEAYPFNVLPNSELKDFPIWAAAAKELLRQNPDWTGIGKLASDVRHAIDYLVTVPEVDPHRIAVAGHSLGGKMSFYAGCLDSRVKVIVASDFGFRWEDTNWDASWYWGEQKIERFRQTGLDHRSLLALHAPNLFILIGGEADNDLTDVLLRDSAKIFKLYTDKQRIYFFNHRSGHQPTFPALESAWRVMADAFDWNAAKQAWPKR